MRLWAAMILMLAMVVEAETVVPVSLRGGPEMASPAVHWAKDLATQIMAAADVQLEWCMRPQECSDWNGRITLLLLPAAPERLAAAALAEAQVYEGRQIRIFLDRVNRLAGGAMTSRVLGHVIAHEITHLLQGVSRHSDGGVMTARWLPEDFQQMSKNRLSFAEEDVELIRLGIKRRGDVALQARLDVRR
jgi:hypothetical protein